MFYPYNIKVNKCSGSCNNINDPYSKLCVSDVVKNMNVKVFNIMPRTNERRHINGTKLVNTNVDEMQVFVIMNKVGIMMNADVNAKNLLTKEYVVKDLFGIQVTVNVNVINHAMLKNI